MKRWMGIFAILMLLCSLALAEDGAGFTVVEESDGNHVIVVSKSVNVREKASTGSKTVSRQTSNTVMEITEELDGWYGVITPEGDYGYVRKAYVQKDYMYVRFLEPTHIRMLPFEDTYDCISPQRSMQSTFLVIGKYNEWLKVKLGSGIGYVKTADSYPFYLGEDYEVFEETFYITSYGTVYLITDPYVSSSEDAARIGERLNERFNVVGRWDNFWVVQYGNGVALVDMESPIITQMEIDYYYSKTPQYAQTAWDTEANGRDGAGSIGTIPEGTIVEVLEIDEPWYIVKYEQNDMSSIAWISMYDTNGIIEEE